MCVSMISRLFSLFTVLAGMAAGQDSVDLGRLKRLQEDVDNGAHVDRLFTDFKLIFNRDYNDTDKETYRRKVFSERIASIREHNALYTKGESSYALGVNKFADMTYFEFIEMYTLLRRERKTKTNVTDSSVHSRAEKEKHYVAVLITVKAHKTSNVSELPATVDWRERGEYVTNVKDQGDCGSCWAVALAGAVEAQMFKTTNTIRSLSVQQIVDCDSWNSGCDGGNMFFGFDYIRSAGGLVAEPDYPYQAKDGVCSFDGNKLAPGTNVETIYAIMGNEESNLQDAVARIGPVIGHIDIHPVDFMSYSKGVYDNTNCSTLYQDTDHAVLVVGYGDDPRDYWLVKNSMGESWGEDGYLRIARTTGSNCGISNRPVYALVGHAVIHSLRIQHLFMMMAIVCFLL